MMDERKKEVLMRTDEHLVRHLEDLNDEIDQCNGRIKDHMIVDAFKDSVKTLHCIGEMLKTDSESMSAPVTDAPIQKMKPTAVI